MIALTRAIPSSFAEATTEVPAEPPIDVSRAREQHGAYVRALGALGLEVIALPADDRFPDGCFVEDCVVVAGGAALVTRSGAPSRRGEVDAVSSALARHAALDELVPMTDPATLDGGDCMRVGRTLYIGLSGRTNAAGVARATEVFAPRGIQVVAIPLASMRVLHLKCVCSPLGDARILLAEDTIPHDTFRGIDIVTVPRAEAYAANCLAHDGRVLVPEGFPATHAILERAGLSIIPLETSEIRKADGALTCLSVLAPTKRT